MNNLQQQVEAAFNTQQFELPVLPSVGTEVIALTQSDDADAKALAQLIQRDVSLAGHVMRIANSAAYASRGQVQTLQQAIAKLGMRQISDMAVALSVGESVFKGAAAMQDIVTHLWRHSLASALWSREIARVARVNAEVAFMCGLLHQVGKPVIVHQIAQLLGLAAKSADRSEVMKIVDGSHQLVGAMLVQQWKMPQVVADAVQFANSCSAAESNRQIVAVVAAASILADQLLEIGADEALVNNKVAHILAQELNFYPEDSEILMSKTETVLSEIETMTL
jgi:putative nucleotidyltransferase with HDIG domain